MFESTMTWYSSEGVHSSLLWVYSLELAPLTFNVVWVIFGPVLWPPLNISIKGNLQNAKDNLSEWQRDVVHWEILHQCTISCCHSFRLSFAIKVVQPDAVVKMCTAYLQHNKVADPTALPLCVRGRQLGQYHPPRPLEEYHQPLQVANKVHYFFSLTLRPQKLTCKTEM